MILGDSSLYISKENELSRMSAPGTRSPLPAGVDM